MQYTEMSFKFPLQVGSWTLKLEQISVEEANQSSYILLLMFPSSKWNTHFFGIDAFSSKDLLPLTTACITCLLRYDIALIFQYCAPWTLSGLELMPAEMLRLQAVCVAVLRRTLSVGLADAWEAVRENETLLFTFSWKIILANAAFAGFSCVVGLWLDLTVAVYKRFWYSVKYHVEFKFDTTIIQSLWHCFFCFNFFLRGWH